MVLLKVTYETLENDYVRYLLHHNWRSAERLRLRLTIHLLLAIAYVGITFSLFIEPLYSWNNIILVFVGLAIQALIPIFMEYRITKAAQKNYKKINPNGFQPTILEVTKDSLTLTKPEGIRDIWLGKITNLEELEDLLIIHTLEFTIMINQKDFGDKENYNNFVTTLSGLVSQLKDFS